MSNETMVTPVGNLTADPELRYTENGLAVANFTVASTPRRFDRQTNEWVDGETAFLRCTVWGGYAKNVANTLTKGMRVMVHGALGQRSYETKDGEKRTTFQIDVHEVGPILRYATAVVLRNVSEDAVPAGRRSATASAPATAAAPF